MHAWLIVAVIAAAAWTCACRRASGPVWTVVLGLSLFAVTSGTPVPHSIATFLWIVFALAAVLLTGVLATLRPLVAGRLIVVFGAGGDRDRTKRRPMAQAVARVADLAILTSDNPRTEDPERILDDLESGLVGVHFERIADRHAAIARALDVARPGDLVLLAGKGHETYQVVGTEKRPFDERTVVRDLLRGAA